MSKLHSNHSVTYKCDDCEFSTTVFNEMLNHARKTKHQLTRVWTKLQCSKCGHKDHCKGNRNWKNRMMYCGNCHFDEIFVPLVTERRNG